jgi:phosphinothricin acetyltransferase
MSGVTPISFRPAQPIDGAVLARIYNHYIRNSVITFEEREISSDDMAARVANVAALSLPWLVVEISGHVAGYAYANLWKERSAYRFAVESSVYLDPSMTGRGVGLALYSELLTVLKTKPVHTVIGGIALPNEASVALHERVGFVKVAHFKEVGFKHERWVDVGYWQLAL